MTMNAQPKYFVLPVGGYADTRADFIPANSQRECAEVGLFDLGYLDNPGAHIFVGSREPWTEVDPYPDYYIERGPRGGLRWESA